SSLTRKSASAAAHTGWLRISIGGISCFSFLGYPVGRRFISLSSTRRALESIWRLLTWVEFP
ncbi:hypothetical protein, partial [Mesorhizobium sp.]|uniref:hypothetical protein n=1 Tax=Mesorhizobium sp. TaxID=1871066 RepID=UPI0025CDF681